MGVLSPKDSPDVVYTPIYRDYSQVKHDLSGEARILDGLCIARGMRSKIEMASTTTTPALTLRLHEALQEIEKCKKNVTILDNFKDELAVHCKTLELKERNLRNARIGIKRTEESSDFGYLIFNCSKKQHWLNELQEKEAQNLREVQSAQKEIDLLNSKMAMVKGAPKALMEAQDKYESLFSVKQKIVLEQAKDDVQAQIRDASQAISDMDKKIAHLAMTMASGRKAVEAMEPVKDNISIALSHSVNDMMGVPLATFEKRGTMSKASKATKEANGYLSRFANDLKLTKEFIPELHMASIGDDLESKLSLAGGHAFCDFFLDGLLFDSIVHENIQRAADSCRETITNIRCTIGICSKIHGNLVEERNKQYKIRQDIVVAFDLV